MENKKSLDINSSYEKINSNNDKLNENNFKEIFNKQSPIVHKIYEKFKESYGSAMKPIYISDMYKGENININPDNVLIDECEYIDTKFDEKAKYCSKKLYDYQRKAILKLREIELNGYIINKNTNEKIITNAQELHLAIGAGKSICLEFLSLFYRNVPTHDIIISKSGVL